MPSLFSMLDCLLLSFASFITHATNQIKLFKISELLFLPQLTRDKQSSFECKFIIGVKETLIAAFWTLVKDIPSNGVIVNSTVKQVDSLVSTQAFAIHDIR